MSPKEIKATLATMRIIVDTREQDTERSRRRYEAFGVPIVRKALNFGDYAYTAVLPSGCPINGTVQDGAIVPTCVVERKMNLDELALCFGKERGRFEREFERAKAAGARVFLLVENATWESLMAGKYRSLLHPNAYTASLVAWMVRYDIGLIFCKAESSGRLIRELLYRDLRERLERGDFDDFC